VFSFSYFWPELVGGGKRVERVRGGGGGYTTPAANLRQLFRAAGHKRTRRKQCLPARPPSSVCARSSFGAFLVFVWCARAISFRVNPSVRVQTLCAFSICCRIISHVRRFDKSIHSLIRFSVS